MVRKVKDYLSFYLFFLSFNASYFNLLYKKKVYGKVLYFSIAILFEKKYSFLMFIAVS